MSNTLLLRIALSANAIFSLASALILLLQPERVFDWLGVGSTLLFRVLGAGLSLFAGGLLYQATRPRLNTWHAVLTSAADLGWVLASGVVLLVFGAVLSPAGAGLIVAVAGLVLVFGLSQFLAAGHAHRTPRPGEYRHCLTVETDSPADRLWPVLGDLGNIQAYMPSLRRSWIQDDQSPAVGVVRACQDRSGHFWEEECTHYSPGQGYAVRFRAEAPEFPFPFRVMRGGWTITDRPAGSRVTVWWELVPKQPWMASLVMPLFAQRTDSGFPAIIKRMTAAANGSPAQQPAQPRARSGPRLVPEPC